MLEVMYRGFTIFKDIEIDKILELSAIVLLAI